MKANLIAIAAGLILAIASWTPVWIIEANDPYAMPVQLGLLALAGSFIGGVIAFAGFVRLAIRVTRGAKKPS